MTTKTQKTSIIAFAALIITMSTPSAFATAGTVEDFYWQNDAEYCYTSQLNDIELGGSTGHQADVESELNDARITYNADLGNINIDPDDGTCPSTAYVSLESESLGAWGYTALTTVYYISSQDKITRAIVEFSTDRGFGDESSSCSNSNKDIEWTANHELGHVVGLKHHNHFFYDHSVMESACVSTWSDIQSVDATALDINY